MLGQSRAAFASDLRAALGAHPSTEGSRGLDGHAVFIGNGIAPCRNGIRQVALVLRLNQSRGAFHPWQRRTAPNR
jgi:hypothetical protein